LDGFDVLSGILAISSALVLETFAILSLLFFLFLSNFLGQRSGSDLTDNRVDLDSGRGKEERRRRAGLSGF
jgi:hypothetical protein